MLTKFCNLHIDLTEIACIGELLLVDGKTCAVKIYLRGGIEIKAIFEATAEEKNNYDGPVKKIFSDRCQAEIDSLIFTVNNTFR